jgi:hypothetical protein
MFALRPPALRCHGQVHPEPVVTDCPERAVPHNARTVSGHLRPDSVVPPGQLVGPFRVRGGIQRGDALTVGRPAGADVRRHSSEITGPQRGRTTDQIQGTRPVTTRVGPASRSHFHGSAR